MLNSTHKKDKHEKSKLMYNAIYGKTMENLRNRIDVKFVSNKKDYLKWKSNFYRRRRLLKTVYKICTNDCDNNEYLAVKYIRFFINDII